MSNQFFYFDPHIFGQISSILVIKQVLYNIFQSTIVTYNFCMIPHSLIFSFILAHFGLKQNPTGLQEVIQRFDKNSKTTLIIKSTLERVFLMKKHQKNQFWNIALFTKFNLPIKHFHKSSLEIMRQSYKVLSMQSGCKRTSNDQFCESGDQTLQLYCVTSHLPRRW